MSHLYALQQRLAITSAEASALLFVGGLLLLGLGVRSYQSRPVAFAPDTYAALDVAVAEGAAALRAPAEPVAAESVIQPVADTEHAVEPVESSRRAAAEPGRLDLNAASASALQRLPGIGPALAGRIVAYRAAHGPFQRPRDLVRVKGIGPKTFEKLAPYLFVAEATGEE